MAGAHPPPAIVVVAGPAPGATGRELDSLLGTARVAALRALLLGRALAWARRAAPGHVEVAVDPGWRGLAEGAERRFELGTGGFGGRLELVCGRMFAGGERPVLIVWPGLSRWRESHASAALGDLAAGCGIVLGPLVDGGAYLIGLERPQPALSSITDEQWRRADAWATVISAAGEAGVLLGLLRAERGLRREQDVRAALADPLTDPELRGLLG